MADPSIEDSKSQLKAIANHKADTQRLYECLTNLSISLVMGQESYLRRFETAQAMPLLVGVVEKYIDAKSAGDVMVMAFRSLSLVLEHVPSSYDAAQEFHKPLTILAFKVMHKALCAEWMYQQTDVDSLHEECLRTVRFVGKDDRTGSVMRHAYIGDLLTLCASENSLMARQALECLLMLCSKVVMPSEFEKPQQSGGFLSLFKSRKKASAKSHEKATTVDDSDNPVVINVENVIAPFLQTLIEQYTATLSHVQEVWTLLEYAIQCLGSLMERALLCHRPHTAHVLVTRELPQLLFRIITIIEDNATIELTVRNERILFIESMLAITTSCHSTALAESLLKAEAKKFFHSVLEDSSGEITTLLDQPFPLGVMAARSTQRRDKDHITSIAAIRLLVLATPNVPPEAFGLKPKVVLPVHQWYWEDELRHPNKLVEEQCVTLETSWTRLSKDSAVVVQTKALPADLLTMTMARGFSGGFRNISRTFTPFVYHFVDESSVRPIAKVKEAGPEPVKAPAFSATATSPPKHGISSVTRSSKTSTGRKASFSTTDRLVVMNESAYVPESHLAIAEEYFIPLCDYATYASGQMAKQLATCACASILQMMFLTNADARVEKLMKKAMLPMCDMFRATLTSGDKATKAVVLTMTEWLLRHSMAAHWSFCDTAQRCGYVSLLDDTSKITPVVAVTKDSRPTRTADLADRSGALVLEITMRLQRQRGTTGGQGPAAAPVDTTRLAKATEALRKVAKEPGTHEPVLKEFFDAVTHSKSVTAYEVHQMELASAALCYLLNGTSAMELFGSAFVFSSGASGSTTTRNVVQSVDFGSTADPQGPHASPAAAMVAGGMRVSDVLQLYTAQNRLRCLMKLVAGAPKGMHQLVDHLVGTLTLQSTFPLVESVITHERVACKTPLQAFQALSDISPRVVVCGKAGRVASPAFANSAAAPNFQESREPSTILQESVAPASRRPSANKGKGEGSATAGATTGGCRSGAPNQQESFATTAAAVAQAQAREFCMRGHRLREVSNYAISCVCDSCSLPVKSGYACRICNFDICRKCFSSYKGNVILMQMMQSPSNIPRNRANLVSSIGDIERYFRTGSTSTKGTQVAPTSQSSLSHLDRFCTRAELLLKRRTTDGGVDMDTLQVARLLLQHPILLRRVLYKALQTFYTRGIMPGDPDAASDGDIAADSAPQSADGSRKDPSAAPALTPTQTRIAEELALEALEDRYILYRPTVGRCTHQETFLSILYQRAFAVGNKQVLLQLENCLMRQEGSNDALTLPHSVLPSPALSSARNRSTVGGTTGPVGTSESGSFAYRAGLNPRSTDAADKGDEFTDNRITQQQSFTFHHFETDSATQCSCGQYSREEFASKSAGDMSLELPDFARRADILLLIFLHRSFYSPSHAVTDGGVDRSKLDSSVFVNSAVTTAVVKALEASALRVAVLPLRFALPRWTSFVLTEARFLVPANARERIARYLAYSARRSFITYMRLFRQYRLDRTVAISPGEWARMSNHKFTVSRARFLEDAFKVLRKASDARLPISIEFVGDVGVGQGPTAQFYTLLAQEVSRANLSLWRNVTLASPTAPSQPQPSSSAGKQRASGATGTLPVAYTHHVPIMSQHPTTIAQHATLPGVRSSSASAATGPVAMVNPPPEGFYPARSKADDNAQLRVSRSTAAASSKEPVAPPMSPPHSGSTRVTVGTAVPPPPPSSPPPSSTRRQRANGQIVLSNPRAVLQDYVAAQRERSMAFYTVGAALGRAFLDEQVFPVPLSSALGIFLRSDIPPGKVSLDANMSVDKEAETPVDLLELPMRAVRLVDPSVASSLESLASMDDATLKALELPFTLPGDDEFELIPGGSKIFVTASNVKRYQRRVLNALLYDSVAFPLRMLTMGCHDVVPREALSVLEIDELMKLLCGEEKSADEPLWTAEEVRSVLVGDHGYQNDSPQLEMLGNILAKKLDPKEQRAFLLFCTGCPRLPVGGVRALGAITVVKRSNAFAHARGMAAAEERRQRGGGEDDDEDAEDDMNPLDGGGATTTVASIADVSSNSGITPANDNEIAPGRRTNSSTSRQGGGTYGTGDAGSLDFELPDSEWALPSVNTCFKYLKLPPYPTEDLMYRKLLVSITQCGDTFELS